MDTAESFQFEPCPHDARVTADIDDNQHCVGVADECAHELTMFLLDSVARGAALAQPGHVSTTARLREIERHRCAARVALNIR